MQNATDLRSSLHVGTLHLTTGLSRPRTIESCARTAGVR